MALLRKDVIVTYTPASPGYPGDPGAPGQAAYCNSKLQDYTEIYKDFDCRDILSGDLSALPATPTSYNTNTIAYNITPVYGPVTTGLGSATEIIGFSYDNKLYESIYDIPVPTQYSAIGITSTTTSKQVNTKTSNSGYYTSASVDSCINYWNATGTVKITKKFCYYGCAYEVCYPEVPARPAKPPTPPSPAQTSVNFQEGWNASAQSIQSLLPGKAALFRVLNGARGILLGFAPEAWVPSLNTLPFGVMYADGLARVFEMGQFKEDLGSFAANQEFMIGRSLDNYIVYINKTDGAQKIRMVHPASANQPVHLFAVLFYGGDAVWI